MRKPETARTVLEKTAEKFDRMLLNAVSRGYVETTDPTSGHAIRKPLTAAFLEVVRKRLQQAKLDRGGDCEKPSLEDQIRRNMAQAGFRFHDPDPMDDSDNLTA